MILATAATTWICSTGSPGSAVPRSAPSVGSRISGRTMLHPAPPRGVSTDTTHLIRPPASRDRYGGGDHGIMEYLVHLVRAGGEEEPPTRAESALESRLMAFAAERSKMEGLTISMDAYREETARRAAEIS